MCPTAKGMLQFLSLDLLMPQSMDLLLSHASDELLCYSMDLEALDPKAQGS